MLSQANSSLYKGFHCVVLTQFLCMYIWIFTA